MTNIEEKYKKRMELYKKGLSDREIANEVGVCKSTIVTWRKKFGLPPNQRLDAKERKKLYDRIKKLYDKGYTDDEISKILGCTPNTIKYWRIKRNLPKNKRCRNCGKSFRLDTRRYRKRFYCDECIAEARRINGAISYLKFNIRSHLKELIEINPERAKEFVIEMKKEEGEEFVKSILDKDLEVLL